MRDPNDPGGVGRAEARDALRAKDEKGAWGSSLTAEADRRRLEQVRAAKREREAARARNDDVSLRLSDAPAGPTNAEEYRAITLDDDLVPVVASSGSAAADTLNILVVCTGNVCRSPYFERVLATDLAGLPVTVSGAGTAALLIDRMSSGSQELLRARGLPWENFQPRQLTPAMARQADLVLTAERDHRHVVVDEMPTAAPRVFALLDFADACAGTDAFTGTGVAGFRDFVREARAGAIERHSHRSGVDASILDPFRQGPEVFERMAAQADPALATVAGTVRRILSSSPGTTVRMSE